MSVDGAGAGTNRWYPLGDYSNTPSATNVWKRMLVFNADPHL